MLAGVIAGHSEDSPSGRWHVSITKRILDESIPISENLITVSAKLKDPQPHALDLPENARTLASSGYPEYDFVWSPKEEWLAIIVTHKYGQSLLTVSLSGPPEKRFKAQKYEVKFAKDEFENGDIGLTQIDQVEFVDEQRCFVTASQVGSNTQRGLGTSFFRQDLDTGRCMRLKHPLSTKP